MYKFVNKMWFYVDHYLTGWLWFTVSMWLPSWWAKKGVARTHKISPLVNLGALAKEQNKTKEDNLTLHWFIDLHHKNQTEQCIKLVQIITRQPHHICTKYSLNNIPSVHPFAQEKKAHTPVKFTINTDVIPCLLNLFFLKKETPPCQITNYRKLHHCCVYIIIIIIFYYYYYYY